MKLKSDYILKTVAGENILMLLSPEQSKKFITLNETALFLFNLIAEGKDKADMVKALLSEYETDETTAMRDVEAFIDTLKNSGILED